MGRTDQATIQAPQPNPPQTTRTPKNAAVEPQKTPLLNKRLRVADVLRKHGPAYVQKYGRRVVLVQRRVLADLTACRTRATGSYAERCTYCGSSFFGGFNSCRNRHCPTCGGPTRARWLNQARQLILPVPHFHLTFTLPDSLSRLILANRRLLYNLLFRSAWETIRKLAADPKHLGGETAAVMVLHTWNQRLDHHPHVHVVVPAGVLLPNGHWRAAKPDYFLPIEVLSQVFRGKFLDGLQRLHANAKLQLQGKLSHLADPDEFQTRLLARLYDHHWVVHVQPAPSACQGPDAVLKYLARYIAGTAISDGRLISHDGRKVTFYVKDRKRKRRFPVHLPGLEFTRRFLMHVLPKGFQRVRYRGLFQSGKRNKLLPAIREQLAPQATPGDMPTDQHASRPDPQAPTDAATRPATCPACGLGSLKKITSRDTPENWVHLLSLSTFAPPRDMWGQLDLANWMPVLNDDPPAPLRSLTQLRLPLVYDESSPHEALTVERCRGQPPKQSYPQAA